MERKNNRDWLWGVFAVALGVLVFLPTLFNDFVFDDHFFVVANPYIRNPHNLWLLISDWHTNGYQFGAGGFWRPLRNISYLLDHMIAGNTPWVFHLGNLLWHGLAIAGLYALARRLRLAPPFAFLAALIFAVHPVQTESVAWIKERDGLMGGALLFWALAAALGTGWRSFAASLLLAAGALLSKETTVVYTPLVLLSGWAAWRIGELPRYPRRFLLLAGAGFSLTIVYLILRQLVLGQIEQASEPPGGTYLATLWTMPRVFLHYLRIILLPTRLELFYQWIKPAGIASPLVWLGILVIAAMLTLVYTQRNRRPAVSLGISIFLLALLPVSNLIPTLQWMAVRFLYIPMAGIGLAAAALAAEAFPSLRRTGRDRYALLLAAALITCWSSMTLFRASFVWKSDVTLWGDAHALWPERWQITVSYAEKLLSTEQPRIDEAAELMAEYPFDSEAVPFPLAWKVRLLILVNRGQWDTAAAVAAQAVEKLPDEPGILNIAGLIQANTGHIEKAVALWQHALDINPYNETALTYLIQGYKDTGHPDASAQAQDKLTRIKTRPRSEWENTQK